MIEEMLSDYEDVIREAKFTILEARKDSSEELYVLNTCDAEGRYQKGELKLKVNVEGRRVRVSIPDTWIPWELSRYTAKKTWLNDPDFVKLVDRRIVTIISTEVARNILAIDTAKSERERLYHREQQLEHGHQESVENRERMSEAQENREKVKEFNERLKPKEVVKVREVKEYKPSSKLAAIIQNTIIDESSKLNALMNIRTELKLGDINYIMTKTAKNEPRIKEWALSLKNNLTK